MVTVCSAMIKTADGVLSALSAMIRRGDEMVKINIDFGEIAKALFVAMMVIIIYFLGSCNPYIERIVKMHEADVCEECHVSWYTPTNHNEEE
jgi:hypothetical protein